MHSLLAPASEKVAALRQTWAARLTAGERRDASLVSVLVLATALRLFRLSHESLWIDEMYSILDSRPGPGYILGQMSTESQFVRPLYYIILHYWTELFGVSVASVRFPAVVFGVVAVAVLFKVGEELFDWRVATVGAALFAVSSFNIRHSQQARMYSLMALFTFASVLYFRRFVKTQSRRSMAGYLLTSFLLLVTHPFGVFTVIAQNGYLLLRLLFARDAGWSTFVRWTGQQITLVGVYVPWIVVLLEEATSSQQAHSAAADPSLIQSLITTLGTFWKFSGTVTLTVLFGGLAVLSVFAVQRTDATIVRFRSLFTTLERVRFRVRPADLDEVVFLFLWLVVPVACMFLVAHFTSRFYSFRYVIGSSGALYVLVARGFSRIDTPQFKRVVVVVLVVLLAAHLTTFYTVDENEQWDEAANFVEQRAEGGELVVLNMGDGGTRGSFGFYFDREDVEIRSFPNRENRTVTASNIGRLPAVVEGHDGVWLVLSHSGDCRGLLVSRLDMRYNLTAYRSLNHIQVYHFETGEADVRPDRFAPPPKEDVLSGCPA